MFSDCYPEELFPGILGIYPGLFLKDAPVWTALDRLKDFIRAKVAPNLEDKCELGVPLPCHLVLLPKGWTTEGFEVVCDDSTNGKMKVWLEGEPVPNASLICAGAVLLDERIQIGQGVLVEAGAMIRGPAIIGDYAEIRHGAYLRGDCLIGKRTVVGHSTEVKHSILLDGAKAGHFAYIGDSILGQDVNLGAGTKLANLRFAPGNVKIKIQDQIVDTGRRKIGAILGNNTLTGCNSVTNPGTVVGIGSLIAPNTTVLPGYYPAKSVIR